MSIYASSGAPQVITTLDAAKGERSHRWPQVLPGGKSVVYTVAQANDVGFFRQSKIAVERLDTHEKRILPIQGTYPRYSPSGHLLFAREGHVFDSSPEISPDGKRVAVSIFSANNVDVWVYDIPHGTLTRLTFDEHSSAPGQ